MNSKRISFGFLVLAVYAMLGVVGLYSAPTSTTEICATDVVSIATSATSADQSRASSGGGSSANVEWHSFLPGAFK